MLRRKNHGRMPLLLLLLLLLGITVATAVAQGRDPLLVPDDSADIALEPQATTSEVWIPVTRDTFVISADRNRNFGFDPFIRFGFRPSGLGAMRPMLFFDLTPHVPRDASITRAELHIFMTSVTPSNDPTRRAAANRLTQSWSEGNVTWNNMPSWGGEIGQGDLSSSVGWHVTNVTNLAQRWQQDPGGNHGVILIGDERPDQNHERVYFSREANNGLFPRLRVEFTTRVDDRAPIANVTAPTPAGTWSPANFQVRWDGRDPNNSDGSPGSGIRWFDVFYSSNNGGTWIIGRAQVTSRSADFIGGQHLQRYDFHARARDFAGNETPFPSGSGASQTWTRVDAQPPNARVNPLPQYTTSTNFTVSWGDTKEQNESGLAHFDVQWRQNEGPWQTLAYRTTATSTTFVNGRNGVLYEFRARGVDRVGNEQPFGEPQAATVVWLEPVAYISNIEPEFFQKLDGPEPGDSFLVEWAGFAPPDTSIASFDVRFRRPGDSTWISWLNATTATSANFVLELDDPDGTYIFQVRARDAFGNLGQFREALQGLIFVDRNEPFLTEKSLMPVIHGRQD